MNHPNPPVNEPPEPRYHPIFDDWDDFGNYVKRQREKQIPVTIQIRFVNVTQENILPPIDN